MKKLVTMVFACLFLLGMATGQAFAEKKIIMKLQSAYAEVLPALGEALPFFKKWVEEASEGTIMVKVYAPGKLVPTFEIHDAVSTGKIHAGYTAPVYIAGKVPATELFTYIPFGCDAPAYIGWFYSGNGMKLYQEMYDQAGFNIKAFLFTVLAPETGGWFRKPIESPKDIRGLRIRWPGLGGKVWQELGASVSLIPGGEIFPSLEKGAIDGTEFSCPAIDAMLGFHKVCKYNYFPGWHQPVTHLELLLNKDTWNAMSPRQKAVMELAVRAVTTYTLGRSTAVQGKAIVDNAGRGVNNNVYSDELLGMFQDTWNRVISEAAAKDPFLKKVWDDYQAYIAEVNPWAAIAYLPRPKGE
jgi:TRAP-type mannitol/chloroaromatic compound transport system substrate-binding protein